MLRSLNKALPYDAMRVYIASCQGKVTQDEQKDVEKSIEYEDRYRQETKSGLPPS